MEIRQYTYVDVYYKETEIDDAMKERKRLKKLGYELSQDDAGSPPYDYCDQYIKYKPFIKK